MTDCYYKVRQVLQSVTDCYYKVRQVLQNATVITKSDVTTVLKKIPGKYKIILFPEKMNFQVCGNPVYRYILRRPQYFTAQFGHPQNCV